MPATLHTTGSIPLLCCAGGLRAVTLSCLGQLGTRDVPLSDQIPKKEKEHPQGRRCKIWPLDSPQGIFLSQGACGEQKYQCKKPPNLAVPIQSLGPAKQSLTLGATWPETEFPGPLWEMASFEAAGRYIWVILGPVSIHFAPYKFIEFALFWAISVPNRTPKWPQMSQKSGQRIAPPPPKKKN